MPARFAVVNIPEEDKVNRLLYTAPPIDCPKDKTLLIWYLFSAH